MGTNKEDEGEVGGKGEKESVSNRKTNKKRPILFLLSSEGEREVGRALEIGKVRKLAPFFFSPTPSLSLSLSLSLSETPSTDKERRGGDWRHEESALGSFDRKRRNRNHA